MSHFGSTVRNLVKAIIGLGSNYYPESLWRLYLINAPTIFRAIWACVKPMVHPETLAKTFILGGPKDFLPLFQREGLPLASIPAVLGGSHPGLSALALCRQAVQLSAAAHKRFPGVAPHERSLVAVANLSAGAITLAAAAAELDALVAAEGAAAAGSFALPQAPKLGPLPPASPATPARKASSHGEPRRSLELVLQGLGHGHAHGHGPAHGAGAGAGGRLEEGEIVSPAAHPLGTPEGKAGAPGGAPRAPGSPAVASLPPRERRHARRPGCLRACFCLCPSAGCGGLEEPPALEGAPLSSGSRRQGLVGVAGGVEHEEGEVFFDARDHLSVVSGVRLLRGGSSACSNSRRRALAGLLPQV